MKISPIIKWHFRVRREAPVFPAFGVTESLAHTNEVLEIPFNYRTARYINYEWLFSFKENQNLKDVIGEKLEENPKYFSRISKKQFFKGEELKKYILKISKKDYTKNQLIKEFKNYIQKMNEFYAFWWLAVPAGEILETKIKEILDNRGLLNYFNEIAFPSKMLELTKERIELMKIGLQLRAHNFRKLTGKIKKQLNLHAERYSWISCSYHLGTPLTAKNFYKRLREEKPREVLQKISEDEARREKIMRMLKNKLNQDEMFLIKILQEIIFYRNYQKETVNRCQHQSEPFLKKVADELELDWSTFLSCPPPEIRQALTGKSLPAKNLLVKRKKNFAIILERGKCRIREKIKEYQIPFQTRDDYLSSDNVLRGVSACPGKVSGYAQIILNKRQLDYFKQGEILVTSMTTPDFVIAMKRASAIITDEGGITCHAAIVSREFGIPCIIGTKIATKVLKDGDLVEVDATKGIVELL